MRESCMSWGGQGVIGGELCLLLVRGLLIASRVLSSACAGVVVVRVRAGMVVGE